MYSPALRTQFPPDSMQRFNNFLIQLHLNLTKQATPNGIQLVSQNIYPLAFPCGVIVNIYSYGLTMLGSRNTHTKSHQPMVLAIFKPH